MRTTTAIGRDCLVVAIQTRRRTDDGTTPTSLRIIVAMCCWLEKPQATATSAIGIGLSRSRPSPPRRAG